MRILPFLLGRQSSYYPAGEATTRTGTIREVGGSGGDRDSSNKTEVESGSIGKKLRRLGGGEI